MTAKTPYLPFALFDNNLDATGQSGAWLLTGLREEVVCTDPATWQACLQRLEDAARGGAWVALAAAYELGYAIEPHLLPLLPAAHGPQYGPSCANASARVAITAHSIRLSVQPQRFERRLSDITIENRVDMLEHIWGELKHLSLVPYWQ